MIFLVSDGTYVETRLQEPPVELRMLKIANPNIKKVLGKNASSPDPAHVAQDTRPHAYTVSAVPDRCCVIFLVSDGTYVETRLQEQTGHHLC